MPTLSSLSALKIHLGISDTSADAVLTQILNSVDTACLRFLNRGGFISASHTEYHSGWNHPKLALKQRPMTAISSVRVDSGGYFGHGTNAFPSISEWTLGTHFAPTAGFSENENNGSVLMAIGGNWPEGNGNIKVVYTAGYSSVPADLQLAVNQICAGVYNSRIQGGFVGKETFGEYSYELVNGGDLPSGAEIASARETLARYREVAV